MKIVETVKKTYLAADVEELDSVTKLKKAVVVNVDEADEAVAREYVRGNLTGKVIDVTLKNANIESIQEADEIGPIVDLMMKYLPIAEKNAKANAVLTELDSLMPNGSSKDD